MIKPTVLLSLLVLIKIYSLLMFILVNGLVRKYASVTSASGVLSRFVLFLFTKTIEYTRTGTRCSKHRRMYKFLVKKVETHPLMTEVEEPSYQNAVTSKDSSIFGIGASPVKCNSWIVLPSWNGGDLEAGKQRIHSMMLVLTN